MVRDGRKFAFKEEIRNQQEFTYDILDGMIDWVRVVDRNGIILYINKSMKNEIGRDIIGEKCYAVLGNSCPCERCITETTISTGLVSEKEETIGDRIFSVKSSPVRDANGEIYAAVEVFRDVTRERRLEKELIKKNEKMSKDLCFARRLQKRILPSKGMYGYVNVDYLYKPSEMLSGDMFDIFQIDDNHFGIYICDVVGHGVTASMMTMFVRQTMRAIKDEILNPSKTLQELHKRFIDLKLDDDKYFTIFYGVIDRERKKISYVNGGHNSVPFLISGNEVHLLESKGYPIASIFDKVEYEIKTADLNKGDKILLYTDGIVEGENELGEKFGLDRLMNIITNNKDDLIKSIEREINQFNFNDQRDDLAAFLLEI